MHLTLFINHCFRLSLLCCKLLHTSGQYNSHKDSNTLLAGEFWMPPTFIAVAEMVPRSLEKGLFAG